jgi:hypothetical protein
MSETLRPSDAGAGYMSPTLMAQRWNTYRNGLKGVMTWTFGDNVRYLQGH